MRAQPCAARAGSYGTGERRWPRGTIGRRPRTRSPLRNRPRPRRKPAGTRRRTPPGGRNSGGHGRTIDRARGRARGPERRSATEKSIELDLGMQRRWQVAAARPAGIVGKSSASLDPIRCSALFPRKRSTTGCRIACRDPPGNRNPQRGRGCDPWAIPGGPTRKRPLPSAASGPLPVPCPVIGRSARYAPGSPDTGMPDHAPRARLCPMRRSAVPQ